MEKYPPYQAIFSKMSYGESQMLDKAFYEEEVRRLCLAFEQQVLFPYKFLKLRWCTLMPSTNSGLLETELLQFHYAVFFAYMRLREQEIRNLMWISECVAQNQKSRIHDSVVYMFWGLVRSERTGVVVVGFAWLLQTLVLPEKAVYVALRVSACVY